jgi:hypothetical protein
MLIGLPYNIVVFTEVAMNSSVLWDMKPRGAVRVDRRFGAPSSMPKSQKCVVSQSAESCPLRGALVCCRHAALAAHQQLPYDLRTFAIQLSLATKCATVSCAPMTPLRRTFCSL